MIKFVSQFGLKEGVIIHLGNFLLQNRDKLPKTLLTNSFSYTAIGKAERAKLFKIVKVTGDEEIGSYQVFLRHGTSDYRVFNQVLLEKEYKYVADFVEEHQPAESIRYIVDAGGNIGLTTLYLKKRFPNAHIVTIEPDGKNMSILQRNIRVNNLKEVSSLQAGLWGSNESLVIDKNFRDGKEWALSLTPTSKTNPSQTIEGITLDEIFTKYHFPHIDILKIDIEGAERFVFADKVSVKNFLAKVKFIAIEIHDEFNIREDILNQLDQNNFNFFNHGELTIGANTNMVGIKNV